MSTNMPSTNPIDLKHKSCKQPQLQNFEPASDTPTIISIANSKIKAHPLKNTQLANPSTSTTTTTLAHSNHYKRKSVLNSYIKPQRK